MPGTMSLDTGNLPVFQKGLSELQREGFWTVATNAYARRAIRNWALVVPQGWTTGSKTLLMKRVDATTLKFSPGTKGPGFVETGTKPHLIAPRFAHALAWRTMGRAPVSAYAAKTFLKSGKPGALHPSNLQFAMVVHHPGYPGFPRLVPMLRQTGVTWNQEILGPLVNRLLASGDMAAPA